MTMQEFLEQHRVAMRAEQVDRNPNLIDDDDKWARTADHWRCRLKCGHHAMTTVFSMGSGHNGRAPTVADVLDSLASDASWVESARHFADWCADLGYDTDSRKAERTYRTCQRQAAKLKRLLGESAYNGLLNDVERL